MPLQSSLSCCLFLAWTFWKRPHLSLYNVFGVVFASCSRMVRCRGWALGRNPEVMLRLSRGVPSGGTLSRAPLLGTVTF